jgi:dephospho-CoA kinase
MAVNNSREPQDKRLVVGVTGRIGAGKTSVARYLSEAHRFSYVRYSQVLSEWKAKDPDSKRHLQAIGWEVMGGGMQAELNARLIARIPPTSDCAVDGLRHPIDFDSLTNIFARRFCLLYIDCPQEIRWERLKARFPDRAEFCRADSHPVEEQIETLRSKAFKSIDNDSSLQELFCKVDTVLKEFVFGGGS